MPSHSRPRRYCTFNVAKCRETRKTAWRKIFPNFTLWGWGGQEVITAEKVMQMPTSTQDETGKSNPHTHIPIPSIPNPLISQHSPQEPRSPRGPPPVLSSPIKKNPANAGPRRVRPTPEKGAGRKVMHCAAQGRITGRVGPITPAPSAAALCINGEGNVGEKGGWASLGISLLRWGWGRGIRGDA